jgi:hypothetical protein
LIDCSELGGFLLSGVQFDFAKEKRKKRKEEERKNYKAALYVDSGNFALISIDSLGKTHIGKILELNSGSI